MNKPIIKSQSSGYVKPDGNPMTGGRWESCTSLWYKHIALSRLTDDMAVRDWLAQRLGAEDVKVEAYIIYTKDETTNYFGFELDDVFEPESFFNATDDCPILTTKAKGEIWERLEDIASDIDGYEPYEID